jgi:transglutaminase-like putative cysteine protease
VRFKIDHITHYAFDGSVFLEPHLFRFRPRNDPSQILETFSLDVSPPPTGLSHGLDFEGNAFALAWFDPPSSSLQIVARAVVETTRDDPFNFFVLPEGQARLPWGENANFQHCLRRVSLPNDPVEKLAIELAAATPEPIPFLVGLNNYLHGTMTVFVRDEGDPFPPSETLIRQAGACRDLAVLFVDICRAVGIPARFVSGYQEGDPGQEQRDLHAWAEAYIPGAGWRGYDPTLGLVVADQHIIIAAAANAADASPVSGTFRGPKPAISLSHSLEVERLR